MPKIVILGECAYDIHFAGATPGESYPGGRMLNAAAILGREGRQVTYVGECARDRMGDLIISYLDSARVVTSSIDRYTEGVTPLNLFFEADNTHPTPSVVHYRQFPKEKFDVVWPRIDAGDIVVFGSTMAIDSRVRPQLCELLAHARTRGALIVYQPGFLPGQTPRITHVMPYILENLETAHIVVGRDADMTTMFGSSDAAQVYTDKIEFYCPTYIQLDTARDSEGRVSLLIPNQIMTRAVSAEAGGLKWQSAALASIIAALCDHNVTPDRLLPPSMPLAEALITAAAVTQK